MKEDGSALRFWLSHKLALLGSCTSEPSHAGAMETTGDAVFDSDPGICRRLSNLSQAISTREYFHCTRLPVQKRRIESAPMRRSFRVQPIACASPTDVIVGPPGQARLWDERRMRPQAGILVRAGSHSAGRSRSSWPDEDLDRIAHEHTGRCRR